jgi:hypothetical protein
MELDRIKMIRHVIINYKYNYRICIVLQTECELFL